MHAQRFRNDVAAIFINIENAKSFGSGRLIASNLVLTARHVVDVPAGKPMDQGWRVCLIRDRDETGHWTGQAHAAQVVWRGSRDLDIALLKLDVAYEEKPTVEIVFASYNNLLPLDRASATGFPEARWEPGKLRSVGEHTATGDLADTRQNKPYDWAVPPASKPDNPKSWQGMSGSVIAREVGEDTLHVFGVVQQVPAAFSHGLLEAARLSEAFGDGKFRAILAEALGEQPQLVPWRDPAPLHPRRAPIAYNIPKLPPHYQPRESDLGDLRARLREGHATIGIIGLKGMGGIGKTVIATALARDASVRADFPDGIAWLTFGRGAPALTKAAELATAITGQATRFETVDAARGQLGEMTRDLRLLLVLDDVWEPEAADPFTGLGPACRVLITTRDRHVLARANANRHDVGLLTPDAARDFLAAATCLPNAAALPQEANAIIRHCGRLPLALAAAGGLVRNATYDWADTLQALEEGATEEFDTSWLPDPEQRNVAMVLRISVERLSGEARACFLACAAFRDDVDVPDAALLRLWSDIVANQRLAKRVTKELEGRSLLTRDEHRYRIHDLYVDYLHHAAAPLAERHAELVACYRSACPTGWDACPDDGYILRHLPWHLREAGETVELRDLLFQLPWLRYKLAHTDINALIADYALLPDDAEAATLAAALTLSAHRLAWEADQLAPQLASRLVSADGPTITLLLDELKRCGVFAPVRGPYLTAPGAELRRFAVHIASVTSVAVLPDGRRAMSGSEDKTLCLWDIESGTALRLFEGHTGGVTSVAVLPDGRRALSASNDKTLRLWDIETGAELQHFEGHTNWVTSVAVLPNGCRAVSASSDRTLRLWDIETGAELRRFEGHTDGVNSVAVLPGRILSASNDKTLRLWDIETATGLNRFKGHTSAVISVTVLSDHRRAVSASWDETLRLWSIETGAELRCFNGHTGPVSSVAVLPDGRRALSASYDKTLRLWDLETGAELRRFEGHTSIVTSIALPLDGRRALSASWDKTLRLWDLEATAESCRFDGHTGSVISLAVLRDGSRAVSASEDNMLHLWDLETGAELRRSHASQITSVAALSDGRRVVWASRDGTLRLWDLETGAELRCFEGHKESVTAVVVLSDGRRVVSASEDRTLRLWDLETGAALRCFEGHKASIISVAALPDGRRLLSASGDLLSTPAYTTLHLWDIETGVELRHFEGHEASMTSIAALPDGHRALSASWDGGLRLWDLETGAELRRFDERGSDFVAVLPDGRRAVSTSRDRLSMSQNRVLRLWDLETGHNIARYVGDVDFSAIISIPGKNQVLTGNALGQVVPFQFQG